MPLKPNFSMAAAISLVASVTQAAGNPPVKVVTAMSTPLRSGHPILFLLSGERDADKMETRLQFPADQRYSKWSVIFDTPVKVEKLEVQTCEGTKPFSDGVELFVDYNERRLFSDGGRKTVKFNVGTNAQALTLGFLESQGLCLERITLKTAGEWLRPRALVASGHSVLADGAIGVSPRTIPDGKRTKFLGSSKSDRKPGEWSLSWENPLIVEGLRVWNGNQNPGDSFQEFDRVRDLEIRADGGKPIRAALEDRRLAQQIEFTDVRAIRSLELKALTSFSGTVSTEPMLGEIQLSAGGETWIPVIPAVSTNSGSSGESLHAGVVRERGYGDILDRELRADDRGQIWKFRFRSDGTFFARVFMDRARVSKAWSVSGMWRVLEKPQIPDSPQIPKFGRPFVQALSKGPAPASTENAEQQGLSLALIGSKVVTADTLDSLPCANHCFVKPERRGPQSVRELPVSEQIELQRQGRSIFFIRNRTEQEKQTIEFRDLKVRIHSLYD